MSRLSGNDSDLVGRLVRYVVVGGAVNLLLFGAYAVLTLMGGVHPVAATTVMYAAGTLLTYLGNASWSFGSSLSLGQFARYALAYGAGYAGQAGCMVVLHVHFGVPHLLVQLLGMGLAVVTIFCLLNFWVFRAAR